MQSIWNLGSEMPHFEPLTTDATADVAIIGGGLFGILTAYQLKKRGIHALVLEADELGSGTTGGSTAKITAQHGLIYHKLIDKFGKEKARQYARANTQAIAAYRELIEAEGIDCDFAECSSYLYSRDGLSKLRDEADAAKKLGLEAELAKVLKLPFEVEGALRFPKQGRFHPLKFLYALAQRGLDIRTNTRVVKVEENTLICENGIKVSAKHIVFACRYPIVNVPGYYFLRMSQQRSFAIAIAGAPALGGIYKDMEDGGLSLRSAYHPKYGDVLIMAAYDIRSGKNTHEGRYRELFDQARGFYPGCELVAKWSAQDARSVDEVPYIGRFSESTPHHYVAAGFNKWGITHAMIASRMISDMIEGRDVSPGIYDPSRFELGPSVKNLAGDVGNTVKGLAKELLMPPDEKLAHIERGEAGIVEHSGEKLGVYRDERGKAHIISSRCPHLGCRLEWNPDDKVWECPCHGSSLDVDGHILSAPTVKRAGMQGAPPSTP